MKFSDVIKPPSKTMLRQFSGLCLVVFGGMAGWRLWQGQQDAWTVALGALAVLIGVVGLIQPAAVRYVFTGWMIVAFPIGWVVSHIALGLMFYLIFTPVSIFFGLRGRDALHRRRVAQASYWTPKPPPAAVRDYFRQF